MTLEDSQRAAVFNLGAALSRGFGPADYVGSIPLELAPVGITVSPDGRWLYATSEIAARGTGAARPIAAPGGALSEGTLTVIDLRRAETDPAASVVATVDAGCQPVRVTTAADGTQVWVTARASDDLLCFAAARLVSDPKRALVAAVRVGEAPVGLAAVRGSSLVVVADSNRFGANGATSDLDVVNVAAALAGRPAVVGHIRAGLFPRDMTLAPDGTLLVSNFDSGQVEAVDVATVPGTPGGAGCSRRRALPAGQPLRQLAQLAAGREVVGLVVRPSLVEAVVEPAGAGLRVRGGDQPHRRLDALGDGADGRRTRSWSA